MADAKHERTRPDAVVRPGSTSDDQGDGVTGDRNPAELAEWTGADRPTRRAGGEQCAGRRVGRLLGVLDGVGLTPADQHLLATLAAQMPTGHVDQLRSLLIRTGRAQEQQARRQRRAERQTEDADFAAAARRMILALGRRGVWAELYRLEADVAKAQRAAVDRLRAEGFSWADIGAEVDITAQAVHKRFRHQPEVDEVAELAAAGDVAEWPALAAAGPTREVGA